MSFSLNLLLDFEQMFQFQFMRHAFEAGTMVAIVAGMVGYFVVLRRSSFAAHALSHIGFAGAAGAVLCGISPVLGMLVFTTIGGVGITVLSPRASDRDVQIGIVLSFMLGLGVLFISLYSGYATEAYSILFGEILGISTADVLVTIVATVVILCAFAVVYRPLLFSSLDEDVAEAKGLHMRTLGIVFMLLVAVATSVSVQVVGVLLIFSLMVTPAAIAQRLSAKPSHAVVLSVIISLFATWLGLFVAFYEPYPVSFFITAIVFVIYVLIRLVQPRVTAIKARHSAPQGIHENQAIRSDTAA